MRRKIGKRCVAGIVAASLILSYFPMSERKISRAKEVEEVPTPYYEFTFDKEVKDGKVENEGSKKGITATISGNGSGLGVVKDDTRGNNVLNLPGGGLNKGALLLPESMFEEVTEKGFAFSFWICIDQSANQYSRIFSATSIDLNSDDGSSGWNAPEFTFVAGQEGAADLASGKLGYHTSVMLPNRSSQLKLVWEKQFSKGTWQHVTISVSPTEYDVYLDGSKISMLYDRNNNTGSILKQLFANDSSILKEFTNNAIGRSVYSTDNDLKAKIDEFRFYNTALTAKQAKNAYDSYAVSQELLSELQENIEIAESKSVSFYTKTSYDGLKTAIQEAKKGLTNPVTDANVERLISNLKTAINALEYEEGITAETKFSNKLLKEETKEAKEVLETGVLSKENEEKLKQAIQEAEKALEGENQQEIDDALIQLREIMLLQGTEATLHFDLSPENSKGEIFHGSTGFLYGVSEVNVPTYDMLAALSPKILVQKAADGKQHPSGDGYRLTSYLKSCGVENIQIYLQDYYLQWPYESNGIEDYNEKVKQIVSKMVEGKSEEEIESYSFVIFNEPNNIWYSGKLTQMCKDWSTIYNTIKKINPKLKVAGPNFSYYDGSAYETFLDYCQKNNCLPEYITWHELNKSDLSSFSSHCKQVKEYVKTYYVNSGIDPILFVNETVNFDDVGNPGALVNWLSIYDEENVYASLPYWGLANSMNELAADANKPNGAWWVYKWYAQMSGKKTPITLENVDEPGAYGRLYGMTSVDDENQMAYSLFGGQKGGQKIVLENIKKTKTFENANCAHVKIYRTKYTGHQGFADETPVEYEGNVSFTGNDLVMMVKDAELMDAYYAVITPATDADNISWNAYEKNWEETYEAEEAELIGQAKVFTKTDGTDLARSNRAEVGGINSEKDGVKFTVDVPQDGKYRVNVYYSSQAPQVNPLTLQYVSSGGQNRAIGALSKHTLSVDGKEKKEIIYDSTVKWGYYNYKTLSLSLTKGKHELCFLYSGEDQNNKTTDSMLCALLDKIDVSLITNEEKEIQVEPEELVGNQKGFFLSQKGNYTGSGLAIGSGSFDFYVNAPSEGYYKLCTKGNGSAALTKTRVNYAKDAKATSEVSVDWMSLGNITIGSEKEELVYLTEGMNHLCLTGNNLELDQIILSEESDITGNSLTIEAEEALLQGTDKKDGYSYLLGSSAIPTIKSNSYASGKKVVEGFRGGKGNTISVTVRVEKAGDYKLSIRYANNEPAPVMKTNSGSNYVHPYNTDLVERYMQITVNEQQKQTVYFKNTFCWDTFKNAVVDVKLKAGVNTITFGNDNSYKFSSLQDDFTPRLDKFVLAPAVASSKIVKMENVTPKTNAVTNTEETGKKENIITGTSNSVKKTDTKTNINKKKKSKVVTLKKQKIVKVSVSAKKSVTIKWKKDKKASGYQVVYASNKKFKRAKKVWVKKKKTTKLKIKKWKKKKMYVKVRSYKKNGKKKQYGKFSKTKKIRVR